ncbi:MAG: hypothetical protein B6226_06200 [Candidatus Cloacimonetes bacterium 4572_65]|nr:MAG: hypothetical protein B6226_06200 [Candidatus Cloacimonetes bacterium 4572_65]
MKYQIIIDREAKEDLRIGHPRQVYKVIEKYIDTSKNNYFILILDGASFLKKIHILDGRKPIPELINKIFKEAISINASSIVTAYSSNLRNLKATDEDVKRIHELIESGKLLRINVLDHLIVSISGYYSFADNNLAGLSKDEVWPYKPV